MRTQTLHLRGDPAAAPVYADSARLAFEEPIQAAPDDAQRHMFLGLALAYLRRKEEAIRECEKGLALQPIAKDGYSGPYNQHLLARIYLLVGEQAKALDQLEPLLTIPYYLSPGWLKIDPTFDPLRKHPRFQRLMEQTPSPSAVLGAGPFRAGPRRAPSQRLLKNQSRGCRHLEHGAGRQRETQGQPDRRLTGQSAVDHQRREIGAFQHDGSRNS